MKTPVGKVVMDCFVIAVAGSAVLTALRWPFKTALFPAAVAIPVFLMGIIDLVWNVLGREKKDEKRSTGDFKLTEGLDPALEIRRTVSMFAWILGFFLIILFVGFPIAIPLFFMLFLKLQGKEGWKMSMGLAAVAWLSFYGLFVWLLNIPFAEGWILRMFSH